jgi:hypothetical protein
MFKVGQNIIYSNSTDDGIRSIKTGKVTKVGKDTVWLDGKTKAEDQVYAAFLWPDIEETRTFLQEWCDKTNEYKTWEDDWQKRMYQLNNKLILESKR